MTKNFWQGDGYEAIIDRINRGEKVMLELSKFCHERAELEQRHKRRINDWVARWQSKVCQGHEYGTTQELWLEFIALTNRVGRDIDGKVAPFEEESKKIKQFIEQHYKKNDNGEIITSKETRQKFETAKQKWTAVNAAYKDAKAAFEDAQADEYDRSRLSILDDDLLLRTVEANVEDLRREMELAQTKLTAAKAAYIDAMETTFRDTQERERIRKGFVVECLARFHSILLNGQENKINEIVGEHKPQDDLQEWDQQNGPNATNAYLDTN